MVKLLENTFRAVNIGLVNELALMCDRMGIDVWEVVNAAKTKPFGFMPFYPGPGLGGHCIPIDPFYLSWKAKEAGFEARFIELAGHVNSGDAALRRRQGRRGAQHASARRSTARRMLVLGIAYKRDIDDIRESPALDVMHVLQERGARVSLYRSACAGAAGARLAGQDRADIGRPHARRTRAATTASSSSPITRAFDYRHGRRVRDAGRSTRATRWARNGGAHVFRLGAPIAAAAVAQARAWRSAA